jgi:hypothetical protein
LGDYYDSSSSKDNEMPTDERLYCSEAAIDLMLQCRASGSAIATLQLALHRHANWTQVTLFALTICQLWLIGESDVPRHFYGVFAGLLIVVVAYFLIDCFMISGRPASAAYIAAALRCLDPGARLALLEQIEKALRRGELRPVLKSDVVEMLKLIQRAHSPKLLKRLKRERQTAQQQAALVDLYRRV